MVASEIRETWTARHNGVLALLVLDVGNDDGSCTVSGKLVSRDLAHAACAFDDNGHLCLGGYCLKMWSVSFYSFSVEGGARNLM